LLGPRHPILAESAEATQLLALRSFFVYPSVIVDLLSQDGGGFGCAHLDASFPTADGPAGLRTAVERLCAEGEARVRAGVGLLVLDDGGVSAERVPVPALLAVGAVHHRLVAAGLRMNTSLIVSADEA